MSYAEISARTVTFTLPICNNSPTSEFQHDLIITHESAPSLQVNIWVTAARTYAFLGREVFLADYLETTLNLLKWILQGPSTPILCLPR